MFFFFKQKTAYEMRISDWSSDVCSSDLCWPSSLRQALSSWPELAQLAHVAPRRTPRAMFSDEVLEGDDIDLSRLPIQRCWPGDVGRLVTLGLVITRGTRKPRQNRSEEHTSELQSLMRISYAVFCLKKKTHNNTQQKHC